MELITAYELNKIYKSGKDLILVDVREPYEFEEYHIESLNIPLAELPVRVQELEPYRSRTLVLICRSGNRSAVAAKFLEHKRFRNVACLQGGLRAWAVEVDGASGDSVF